MAEADLHLKLDRLLAQQERMLTAQDDFDETIRLLIRGLTAHGEALSTLREGIEQIWQALLVPAEDEVEDAPAP